MKAYQDTTTVAVGVTRRELTWGYILEGTKEALLSAGLAKEQWFPDGVKRNKRGNIIRTAKFEHEGVYMECQQLQRRGWFSISASYSREERERRQQLYGQRREYEKALEDERKELAHMPQTHEAYREQYLRYFEAMYEDSFSEFFGETKFHGYSFAPEVLEAAEAQLQEIRNLLETGRTLYSAERQQARINEVRAKVAAADPGLRAFLDRVTGNK